MRFLAVTAHPVLHSLSPVMHNAGLKACGIDGFYTRLAATSWGEAFETARSIGIHGLNVSSPFKENAFKTVDRSCSISKRVEAVNTVCIREDGSSEGFNTDSFGVVEALKQSGVSIKGSHALVLGAGGAARAAIVGLQDAGATVSISNRTILKGESVATKFGVEFIPVNEIPLHGHGKNISILVSTVGNTPEFFGTDWMGDHLTVLDATYAQSTWLQKIAKERGCHLIDGKEWLLHQGAQAFTLFTEASAPLAVMRNAIMHDSPLLPPALIGMMGSGKTSVGKNLAHSLTLNHIDSDHILEQQTGLSISSIFNEFGEDHFRSLESTALLNALEHDNSVISTGGGSILSMQNREALRSQRTVLWLWASPEILAKRISSLETRPLLGKSAESSLQKIFGERKSLYYSLADLIIQSEGRTIEECVELITYEYSNHH